MDTRGGTRISRGSCFTQCRYINKIITMISFENCWLDEIIQKNDFYVHYRVSLWVELVFNF